MPNKAAWALAPGNLYCGPATAGLVGEFGNPFSVREHGRERAIELYKKFTLPNITDKQKQKVRAASRVGCYCEQYLARAYPDHKRLDA